MMLGRLTPDEAGPVIGQPANGARHVTVGTLRAAGFDVVHSPSPENPTHVSVIARGDWGKECDDSHLNGCFEEAEWHEEPQGEQ